MKTASVNSCNKTLSQQLMQHIARLGEKRKQSPAVPHLRDLETVEIEIDDEPLKFKRIEDPQSATGDCDYNETISDSIIEAITIAKKNGYKRHDWQKNVDLFINTNSNIVAYIVPELGRVLHSFTSGFHASFEIFMDRIFSKPHVHVRGDFVNNSTMLGIGKHERFRADNLERFSYGKCESLSAIIMEDGTALISTDSACSKLEEVADRFGFVCRETVPVIVHLDKGSVTLANHCTRLVSNYRRYRISNVNHLLPGVIFASGSGDEKEEALSRKLFKSLQGSVAPLYSLFQDKDTIFRHDSYIDCMKREIEWLQTFGGELGKVAIENFERKLDEQEMEIREADINKSVFHSIRQLDMNLRHIVGDIEPPATRTARDTVSTVTRKLGKALGKDAEHMHGFINDAVLHDITDVIYFYIEMLLYTDMFTGKDDIIDDGIEDRPADFHNLDTHITDAIRLLGRLNYSRIISGEYKDETDEKMIGFIVSSLALDIVTGNRVKTFPDFDKSTGQSKTDVIIRMLRRKKAMIIRCLDEMEYFDIDRFALVHSLASEISCKIVTALPKIAEKTRKTGSMILNPVGFRQVSDGEGKRLARSELYVFRDPTDGRRKVLTGSYKPYHVTFSIPFGKYRYTQEVEGRKIPYAFEPLNAMTYRDISRDIATLSRIVDDAERRTIESYRKRYPEYIVERLVENIRRHSRFNDIERACACDDNPTLESTIKRYKALIARFNTLLCNEIFGELLMSMHESKKSSITSSVSITGSMVIKRPAARGGVEPFSLNMTFFDSDYKFNPHIHMVATSTEYWMDSIRNELGRIMEIPASNTIAHDVSWHVSREFTLVRLIMRILSACTDRYSNHSSVKPSTEERIDRIGLHSHLRILELIKGYIPIFPSNTIHNGEYGKHLLPVPRFRNDSSRALDIRKIRQTTISTTDTEAAFRSIFNRIDKGSTSIIDMARSMTMDDFKEQRRVLSDVLYELADGSPLQEWAINEFSDVISFDSGIDRTIAYGLSSNRQVSNCGFQIIRENSESILESDDDAIRRDCDRLATAILTWTRGMLKRNPDAKNPSELFRAANRMDIELFLSHIVCPRVVLRPENGEIVEELSMFQIARGWTSKAASRYIADILVAECSEPIRKLVYSFEDEIPSISMHITDHLNIEKIYLAARNAALATCMTSDNFGRILASALAIAISEIDTAPRKRPDAVHAMIIGKAISHANLMHIAEYRSARQVTKQDIRFILIRASGKDIFCGDEFNFHYPESIREILKPYFRCASHDGELERIDDIIKEADARIDNYLKSASSVMREIRERIMKRKCNEPWEYMPYRRRRRVPEFEIDPSLIQPDPDW